MLIVSPVSGLGKSLRFLPSVVDRLRKAQLDVVVAVTQSIGHASELAGQAAAEGRVAVAVGGDGLVSCVAHATSIANGSLGIIPTGRGNDFARALGIRRYNAVDVLIAGSTRKVDLGAVGDRCFTSVASVGFDSNVVDIANRSRVIRGRAVYPWATLRALRAWRPSRFEIEIDGSGFVLSGFSVAVSNSGVYGGGMKIAPASVLDDGWLDVVAITEMSRLRFLVQLPRVMNGSHVKDARVRTWRAKRVRLQSQHPASVVADGEIAGSTPVTIEVKPASLNVVAPG